MRSSKSDYLFQLPQDNSISFKLLTIESTGDGVLAIGLRVGLEKKLCKNRQVEKRV